MSGGCLFCRIVKKEIPSNIVFEDRDVLVFRDIFPQAPVHCLIVPKAHFANLNEIDEKNANLLGKIFLTAKKIAEEMGISETGYRTVFNTNKNACQSVFHIHLHLLGGRELTGQMG